MEAFEWVEVIGLLIMFLAVAIPAIRRSIRRRRMQRDLTPEQIAEIERQQEEEQRKQYEQFLISMGAIEEVHEMRKVELARRRLLEEDDLKQEEELPEPPPVIKEASPTTSERWSKEFHSDIEERTLSGGLSAHHLHFGLEDQKSDRLVSQSFRREVGEKDAYALPLPKGPSQLRELLRQPNARRSMVLLSEVIHRPKGESVDDEYF